MDADLPGAVALSKFCRADASELELTDDLRQILEVIALTGNYWHEWSMLKCLISFRLKQVLTQYYDLHVTSGKQERLVSGETFAELEGRLLECLDSFLDGPPFTLQRLCELLVKPTATYPNIDKVALAFEKVLLVTSTIPICREPYPSFDKNIEENCHQISNSGKDKIVAGVAKNDDRAADEEMVEISTSDDRQEKMPSDEASLSLENRSINHVTEPSFEKMHMSSDQSPMLDGLVDVPLDDKKSSPKA